MSLHHKTYETSHDIRRSKVQKKQKETQKLVKPWTSLSEDAVVVKYLLWLTGSWTNSGKWDQLLNIQKPPPELQEAGEFWGLSLLFYSILLCPEQWLWATAPKWEPESWPVSHRIAAIGKRKTIPPHILWESWIFTYPHLILCLSYLHQKLIICFLVWWRWACSFGVYFC